MGFGMPKQLCLVCFDCVLPKNAQCVVCRVRTMQLCSVQISTCAMCKVHFAMCAVIVLKTVQCVGRIVECAMCSGQYMACDVHGVDRLLQSVEYLGWCSTVCRVRPPPPLCPTNTVSKNTSVRTVFFEDQIN